MKIFKFEFFTQDILVQIGECVVNSVKTFNIEDGCALSQRIYVNDVEWIDALACKSSSVITISNV